VLHLCEYAPIEAVQRGTGEFLEVKKKIYLWMRWIFLDHTVRFVESILVILKARICCTEAVVDIPNGSLSERSFKGQTKKGAVMACSPRRGQSQCEDQNQPNKARK